MYAIVDIETTGLGVHGNKITEISIFVHDGQKVVKEFTSLVNPESPISYRISGLTGITNDMVRTAPKFYEIAKEVISYTEGCIFVAHNVNFDYNVIQHELQSLGASFKRPKLCTVRLSRKLIPGQRSYSLGRLCTTLGIDIKGRHRARGDAEATVTLLEKLIALDQGGVIDSFLHPRSKQATLPPLLPKAVIDNLPSTTGVYYFKDAQAQVIYVGKAVNIKQRVLSHIYSKANKELRLCNETADISYIETGSELLALLLESDEIKQIYPKYNRAQKRKAHTYGIGTYQDRRGITHIVYNRIKLIQDPIFTFYTEGQCRAFLTELCEQNELCPRYCSLQQISGPCFHYQIKSCRGVCRAIESVEAYNARVAEALQQSLSEDSYTLKVAGRKKGEVGVVLIKNGSYKGFGYVNESKTYSFEELETKITPRPDNNDIQRILRWHLRNQDADLQIMVPN